MSIAIQKHSLSDGSFFGDFKITRFLGAGGTSEVYLATDNLERRVALKVLKEEGASLGETFIKRFIREGKIVGELNHPNIVRIYTAGAVNDKQFIANEYLEGETLKEEIEKRRKAYEPPFAPREVLEILLQLADGLRYMHKKGIIHRDVNPSNMMVLDDRTVKILDFGIAKKVVSEDTIVTEPQTTVGTLAYMAPEQLMMRELSDKTDQWGWGCVAYELYTLKKPFKYVGIENQVTRLQKITEQNFEGVKIFNPAFLKKDKNLEDIIRKTLDPDPDGRYPNTDELYNDLVRYQNRELFSVKKSLRKKLGMTRRQFILSATAAAAGISAGGVITVNLVEKNAQRRKEALAAKLAYEHSLYSTLDRIQAAQTWDEMKPWLKELETKLFDWVLERSKHLRKEPTPSDPLFTPYSFQGSVTNYTDNLHYGSQLMRNIYEQGFIETGKLEFLKLFAELYKFTDFSNTLPYQCYLDRFKISKEMIDLLNRSGFPQLNQLEEKIRLATFYLINERYHSKTGFFQYINPKDEQGDRQLMYVRTQVTIIPSLIESARVFNIKESLNVNFEEYLNMIRKQTKISNSLLIGDDNGVYFGRYFNPFTKEKKEILFQKNVKAYNSYDIITYLTSGLGPIITLYEEIEKRSRKDKTQNLILEKNISTLHAALIDNLAREKEELMKTFFKILEFYRKNLSRDYVSLEFIPIQSEKLNANNVPSLSSTLVYFNFINELSNGTSALSGYLPKNALTEFSEERLKLAKVLFHKSNFNQEYNQLKYQSFLKGWNSNSESEPPLILVQDEREFIKIKKII